MVSAGDIIRASHINNVYKQEFGASTGGNTFSAGTSNVRQDITGLTFDVVTINPNARVLVSWVCDCTISTTSAGQNMQFRLEVDGVAQTPLAIKGSTTAERETVSAMAEVLHAAAGTYTYQITGISSNSAIAASCGSGLSTMRADIWDLAA